MVDFMDGQTVAKPLTDLLKIMILERYDNFIESYESYYRMKFLNKTPRTNDIRSRLLSLFSYIKPAMLSEEDNKHHDTTVKSVEALEIAIKDKDVDEIEEAFEIINAWLYKKKITKFDNITRIDYTNIEAENKQKGI